MTVAIQGKQFSKLCSVVDFIVELIRFDISKPALFFYCLRRLVAIRSRESIQLIRVFVEKVGPLMLSKKTIQNMMNKELDHIRYLCKEKLVDSFCTELLMSAYYTCRPAERPRVKRVELPPYQRYVRYLLNERLFECRFQEDQEEIASHLLRMNLSDPNTLLMIVGEILRVPSTSYVLIEALALLCCEINVEYAPFLIMLVDAIYDRLMMILDFMPPNCQQEALALIEFVYTLYDFKLLSSSHIFYILYLLIEYGHNVLFLPSCNE